MQAVNLDAKNPNLKLILIKHVKAGQRVKINFFNKYLENFFPLCLDEMFNLSNALAEVAKDEGYMRVRKLVTLNNVNEKRKWLIWRKVDQICYFSKK